MGIIGLSPQFDGCVKPTALCYILFVLKWDILKISIRHFIAAFLILLVPGSALAKRVLKIPPTPKRIVGTEFPNGALYDGRHTITTQYHVLRINLVNLGEQTQTGKIVLTPNSVATGWMTGLILTPFIRFFVCDGVVVGASPNSSANARIPADGLQTPFTVPKGGVVELSAGYIYHGSRMAPGTALGFDSKLMVEVHVNEDRGALVGTVLPFNGGGFPGNVTCFNENISNYASLDLGVAGLTEVPFALNGGRPF